MLRFLQFELLQEDSETSTYEAMASVRLADVPELEAEGKQLLAMLPQWLGSEASPLDLGGEWDVWVQANWEGQDPVTVDHLSTGWSTGSHVAEHTAWWTLTITLVVSSHLLDSLQDHLPV